MVDNQHKKITGYRDLTDAEISMMNEIKAGEVEIAGIHEATLECINELKNQGVDIGDAYRQLAIAKTEFEHAFMRLVRAVARPVSPWK